MNDVFDYEAFLQAYEDHGFGPPDEYQVKVAQRRIERGESYEVVAFDLLGEK